MEAALLGPLEVRIDGRVVSLGGPKQRALLASLLLHANEAVSRDRLIDALWGEHPPASAGQSLDTYLSRLRRALGGDRITRVPGGYSLRVEDGELDLHRFERLVRRGREAAAEGSVADAAAAFRAALALWRGPALADVLYEPFARDAAPQLDELRLTALEDRIEAELALGHAADIVAELERLVAAEPGRERLTGQLALALYRSGRQADALATIQRARRWLGEQLGLDTGPQLRELERLILQQDATLQAPRRRVAARRRRWTASVGVALMAIAAVAALVVSGGHARSPRPVVVPGTPTALAFGSGAVWAVYPSADDVARADPASGAVVDRIGLDGEPGAIAAGGGAIWVASTLGGLVHRIDPETDVVTATVRLTGADVTALAYARGSLWIADASGDSLIEVRSGAPRRRIRLDLRPAALVVAGHRVLVAGASAGETGTVEEFDARSLARLAVARVGNGPRAMVFAGGAVWVANALDATVSRIDPDAAAVVATIPVGGSPTALAAAGDVVWVAGRSPSTLARIDVRTNDVAAVQTASGAGSLAAAGDRVWVGAGPSAPRRGGTLTLLTAAPFASLDPELQDSSAALTRLTYDSLVTFEAAPGPAGLQLVPDLAVAVPVAADGGTTYTFRLRPGIRYSDGRGVRATDFRRAVERVFRLDSPGASLYAGLVGAAACHLRPTRCDLRQGITSDDAAGTVTFHLRLPDPDFLQKLTVVGFSAPAPAGTPDREADVLGTGPYRVATATRRRLRLVRNPFFHEWSHAAQPDGNPDAIVWRFGLSPAAQVDEIEGGRADWTGGVLPTTALQRLRVESPARLHDNPTFDVQFVALNTFRPPFNDVRVRRALNYAIDRGAVAQMFGLSAATPTCQPLVAGLSGYRRSCPYTRRPRRDGRWSAPNPALARLLVAASGTRGSTVTVWAATDLSGIPARLPAYVAGVLRSLGYRTHLHLVPYASFSPQLRRRLQLTVDGDWVPDYPAPGSYLPQFFSCAGGNNRRHYVCDPELDQRLRRAAALQLSDPAGAAAFWARIDHELVARAFWAPMVNVREIDLVSSRLRNYVYHPVWGFLPDQASLG